MKKTTNNLKKATFNLKKKLFIENYLEVPIKKT